VGPETKKKARRKSDPKVNAGSRFPSGVEMRRVVDISGGTSAEDSRKIDRIMLETKASQMDDQQC